MDVPANRKIPAMVMLVAILTILRSFAVILSGVIVFAFRNDAQVQDDSGLSSSALFWISVLVLAVGILLLWGAAKVIRGQKRGRLIVSIFLVLSMLVDLIPIFLVGRASRASSITGEVLTFRMRSTRWLSSSATQRQSQDGWATIPPFNIE